MTSKSIQDPVDRLKQLSEKLRNRRGIDWNVAKFELPREITRVEFIRGRDFERYFIAHEDLLDAYTDKASGKSVEERIADLGNRFLKNAIVVKAQRRYKKPKPGKPRLVKWPRTLLPAQSMDGWDKDAFYVWKMDRPTSVFSYFMAVLTISAIFAGCLLPIAPYIVKLCVFYFSLSILVIIGSVLMGDSAHGSPSGDGCACLGVGRGVVWLSVWMIAGHDLWILPNILTDVSAIKDLFSPVVSFTKTEGPRSRLIFRILTGMALLGFCWFLLAHNPGGKAVRDRAKEAHDTLLDLLSIRQQITETSSTEQEL